MSLQNTAMYPLLLRAGGAFLVIASVVTTTHLIESSVALTQDPPAEAKLPADDLLDDDLLADDDLLGSEEEVTETEGEDDFLSIEAHEKVFAKSNFPSADECALCHPKQYKEWSVSQHAYSQLSPLMMSMQNAMNVGTSTTNASGELIDVYTIPAYLRGQTIIAIRLESPTSGYYAYNWFLNE